MSINTAEIPQIDGDLDAVDTAGKDLKSAGHSFATTGSDVHATWQGLSGVYTAPESGELLAATAPVSSDASTVGTDVGSVGTALSAYAAEVKPLKAELERLRLEALSFNSSIAGDDEWDKDKDKVNQKNNLLKSVNAAVAAWQAAERTCASAINSTYGGVQYRADDGDGTHSPDEYGYSKEMLDGATAGDQGVPWGKASEVDKPWYEDVVDGVVSFGKGVVVDGLWGAVRGLGTMVGVDGAAAAGQAWAGIGKLALALTPVGMVLDQTGGFGLEKGELSATAVNAGKALIAYDMWGQDPARAAGAVTGNVLGAIIGTKGAGAAVKAGTVAKVGGTAARVFPKASELAANIGGKVGDLKLNVASTLNTKVASLADKLPRFGPEPAMAGGRGGGVFDVTRATNGGTSGTGFATRVEDVARTDTRVGTTEVPSASASEAGSTGARPGGLEPSPPTGRSSGISGIERPSTQQTVHVSESPGADTSFAGRTDLQPHSEYVVDGRGTFITDDTGRVSHIETPSGTRSGGWNQELMQPTRNASYVVDGRYGFHTDDLARTTRIHGDRLEMDPRVDTSDRRYGSVQTGVGHEGGPGYEGGHGVATKFYGPGEKINLLPQLRDINRGPGDSFGNLEGGWRKMLRDDPTTRIGFDIRYSYADEGKVPDMMSVQHEIDGVPVERKIYDNLP